MNTIPAIIGGNPIFDSKINIVKPQLPAFEEIQNKVENILSTGMVTKGQHIQEFENAVIKDDVKVIPYKNVISKYVRRMKEVYENVPSQHQIRKLLRQIGFVDSINRKVIRIGADNKPKLCLIYDIQIKENLGIKEEQSQIKTEKI